MLIRLSNLKIPLDDGRELAVIAAAHLKISPKNVTATKIIKKAVDARRRGGSPIMFVYTLELDIKDGEKLSSLKRAKDVTFFPQADETAKPSPAKTAANVLKERRPVVVGFGPAGMFAALTLARAGFAPIVVERGEAIEKRTRTVKTFWSGGALNPESNVEFGEGGAGTFSDGKLTTRIGSPLTQDVADTLVSFGAPDEIRYAHKPHIGTDLLVGIVKNIRAEIIRRGGEIFFDTKLTDFETKDGGINAIIADDEKRIETSALFLAIGHSARDTYEMLAAKNAAIEAKDFAVGLRIEHPQEFIDRAQYGKDAGHPRLPAADYALTFKDAATGRGVYSFCMCPGGKVIAAASEANGVVTNGMSRSDRASGTANAAILVQVRAADFAGGALAGMRFQRDCENRAFVAGGKNFFAPVMSVGDFLGGKRGAKDFLVTPTYRPGVRAANLDECLPRFVTDAVRNALVFFDRKIPGFAAPDVPLTGIETRSSAPCRIKRNPATLESENIANLYPIGEGAGYAGGIMSSAVDGIKAANAYINRFLQT